MANHPAGWTIKWRQMISGVLFALLLAFVLLTFMNHRLGSDPNHSVVTEPAATNKETPTQLAFTACELPCWRGIIPGTSTSDQATEVARSLPHYNHEEGLLYGKETIVDSWDSGAAERRYSRNGITSEDGLVKEIALYDEKGNDTLGEIVSKYGPPEKMRAIRIGAGGGKLAIELVYPSKGLEFTTDFVGSTWKPSRSMKVTGYRYFSPMSWTQYMGTFLGGSQLDFQDWIGFED